MIESATITGLSVLVNRGIQSITIRAGEPIQLVIGHNGAGKSSVLRELNCMPAKPANYQVGGGKTIVQHYNGHRYEFISTMRKNGAYHSLYKDGVPLCENVNATHQASVIAHELGISQQVIKVLYREYKFTQMEPGAMERLLPELLNIDLSYGLSVYKGTRQSLRDASGVIKHLNGRIESISAEIQSLQGVEEAEAQMEQLVAEIERIHPYVRPQAHRVSPEVDYNRGVKELADMRALIQKARELKAPTIHRYSTITRPETYGAAKSAIDVLSHRINENSQQHAEVSNELVESRKLLEVLENTEGGADRLRGDIAAAKTTIEKIDWQSAAPYSGHYKAALDQSMAAISALDIVATDHVDECVSHTPDDYKNLEGEIQHVEHLERRYANRLNQLRSQLTAQRAAIVQQVNCPNCETVICQEGHAVVTEQAILDTENSIKVGEEHVERLVKERDKLVEVKRGYDHYRQCLERIRTIITDSYHLKPFWSIINGPVEIYDSLQKTTNALRALKVDLELWLEGARIKERVEAMEDTLKTFEVAEANNPTQRCRALELRLKELDQTAKQLRVDYKALQAEVRYFDELSDINLRLQATEEEVAIAFKDWIRNSEHAMAEGALAERQTRLAEVKHRVDSYKGLKSQRDSYVSDLSYGLQAKDDLDYLERFLSPRRGFLGQKLKACIQLLCDQMNLIIGAIWTEPLEVLPCFTDTGLVDYRFKAQVNGSTVEKLSELSMGERDVLDLVFILAVYQINHFQCYPLYVDEVGSSFDYGHRQQLMRYLGQLIELYDYRQIFMVNHYAGEYGGLTGMEVLALSENNVVLPETYNQHVDITYV